MYINKVFLFGNLTRDPELKSLPSGNPVVNFGLATNRTWKDKSGARQEAVEFHNIVSFGKQAELIAQYLRKGSSAFIEGRIQTRSWDAQDGTKRYRTEVIAERVQFGPRGFSGGNNPQTNQPSEPTRGIGAPKEEQLDTIEYPEEDNKLDEIPF